MKKVWFVVLLVAIFAGGCASNQDSSKEEAKFVVEKLPDFQELTLYLAVQVRSTVDPAQKPRIKESEPALEDNNRAFIHEAVYKTKSGTYKIVFLDDSRPPKIIATREIK